MRLLLLVAIFLTLSPCPVWAQLFLNAYQQYNGQFISEVRIENSTNLQTADLRKKIELAVGEPFRAEALELSIKQLYQRNIFDKIEVVIEENNTGIAVVFTLIPVLTLREFRFLGNFVLSDKQLISSSKGVKGMLVSSAYLQEVVGRIKDEYRARGYRETKVSIELIKTAYLGRATVLVNIVEGEPIKITESSLIGSCKEKRICDKLKEELALTHGLIASKERAKEVQRRLILIAREENYLSASAKVLDYNMFYNGSVELKAEIFLGYPVKIEFSGNTKISRERLLEPLRIQTRTVPLVVGAIEVLCREIKKIYREEGYYKASISCNRQDKALDGLHYLVKIEEGEKYKLAKVEFRGIEKSEESVLKTALPSFSGGGWFSKISQSDYLIEHLLEEDLVAIKEFFFRQGYRGVKIETEIKIDEKKQEIELSYLINKGQPQVIGDVQLIFENITEQDREKLGLNRIDVTVLSGSLFNIDIISEEKLRILQGVRSLSYPASEITIVLEEENNLIFLVSLGPRVVVGDIFIQGTLITRDRVVLNKLEFEEGNFWTKAAIDKSIAALYSSGFFRSVSIGPVDGVYDSPVEDMAIRLRERDSGRFNLGVSYNTEDGLQLKSEVSDRNIAGTGTGIIFSVDGYFRDGGKRLFDSGRARMGFRTSDLWNKNIELYAELFGQFSLDLRDQYSYDRIGTSVELKIPLNETWSLASGFSAYQEDLFDLEPDVIAGPRDTDQSFYNILSSRLIWDKRNDAFNPSKGSRLEFEARFSTEHLFSDVSFVELGIQHSIFIPLSSYVLSNNFQFRILEPFSDTEVIPISNRIFLGGRNSLRGYSPGEIGPRGELLNIAGGDRAVVNNTELSIPIKDKLYGIVFLDVGQAVLDNVGSFSGNPNEFSDLRFSPGFGIRYQTPIGPLSAEYGFATEREFGERFGRFFVGIGGAF